MIRKSSIQKLFDEAFQNCDEDDTKELLCLNGHCKCGKKILRSWLIDQSKKCFGDQSFSFMTIFVPRDTFPLGQLHRFKPADSKRSIRRYLKDLKPQNFRAIGFFDIELLEYTGYQKKREPNWCVNWHFICIYDLPKKQLAQNLYGKLPQTRKHQRPVMLKATKPTPFNYTYLMKFIFEYKRKLHKKGIGQAATTRYIENRHRKELEDFLQTVSALQFIFLIGLVRRSGTLVYIN